MYIVFVFAVDFCVLFVDESPDVFGFIWDAM